MKFNKIALSLFAAGSSLLAIDSVTNLSVGTPHNSGTVTNDSTIDFTWTPPTGVAKYYYKLDTNGTNYDFVSAGSYDVLPSSTETSLEVTAPASGDYYLHIAAVDGSDGTSAPKIVQVTSSIDLDAGTVTINPTAGAITTDTNTITLSGSETGTIYYTVNGDTPDTNSNVYVTPLTLGVGATVKAILKDTAGNVQATASESTYTITNNPTITTAAGAAINGQTISTTNTEAVTGLDVNGVDLTKYQYSIDSDSGHTPVGDMDTNIDISTLSTGQHTVYVRGGDAYNYQTSSTSVTFTVDNTAPSNLKALVSGVEADENNASTVTFADNFTFTLSSNEGTIKYTTDGTTPTKTVGTTYTSAVTTTKSVSTGSTSPVVLKMVSYDEAGNISPVTTVNFTIDKEAPTLTMPTTQAFASSIDVAISSDDNDATIYYLVSNSATTTASNIKNNGQIGTTAKVGQNPSTQQDDGNYKYLHAIAVDSVGNGDSDSDVQTVEFTYSAAVVTVNLDGVTEDSTIATSSANGATATTQITLSGSNFTYYKYKFNDSNLSGEAVQTLASTPTINLTGLNDGNNTLYIGVDDETTGDFNATTKSISFIVDNTAPSVPSLTGRVFQGSLDVDLVKPTDADYLLYKLNDGNYTTVTASTSVTIDANTTISLKSKDLIGNESNVTSANFEIGDFVELTITSDALALQGATGTTQTGKVTVKNAGTSVITIDDANITLGGTDFNVTANGCTNVPASQSCDISVSFAPTSKGAVTNQVLTVAYDGTYSNEINTTISGLGLGSAPTINTTELNATEDVVFTTTLESTDIDGDNNITYSLDTNATNGVVSVEQNGSVSYTPTLNFNGTDSFIVTVTDGTLSNDTNITLNIVAVDDAPVITTTLNPVRVQASNTDANITIDVNATDVEDDSITFDVNSSSTSVASASIDANSGVLTIDVDGNGTAIITVIAVTAENNTTGTFTVTVKDTNVSFDRNSTSNYNSDTNSTETTFDGLTGGKTLTLNENDNGKVSATLAGTNDINLTVDVVGTDISVDENGSLTISLSDGNVSKELSVNADGTISGKLITDDNKTTEIDVDIAEDIAPTLNSDGSIDTVFTSNAKTVTLKIKSDGTVAPTITGGVVLPTSDLPAGTKATVSSDEKVKFEFSLPTTLEFN